MKTDLQQIFTEVDERYVLEAALCIENRQHMGFSRMLRYAAGVILIILLGTCCIFHKQVSAALARFLGGTVSDTESYESANVMMGGYIASDGTDFYVYHDLIYRIDMKTNQMVVNCEDLLCDHEGTACTANLSLGGIRENTMPESFAMRRTGESLYAIGSRMYEIRKNEKVQISYGGNDYYGTPFVFDTYVAYFSEEDTLTIMDMNTGGTWRTYEEIPAKYGQGEFYYNHGLYYMTEENQFVRLDLNTGELTLLEKKGATRACVYGDYIYYVQVSTDIDTNYLIKMDPKTLEKTKLLEGVFYYNMAGDRLYYSSYPERDLWRVDLDGNHPKLLADSEDAGFSFGWIWTMEGSDRILLAGEDYYTYYAMNLDGEIAYDQPIVLPHDLDGWVME